MSKWLQALVELRYILSTQVSQEMVMWTNEWSLHSGNLKLLYILPRRCAEMLLKRVGRNCSRRGKPIVWGLEKANSTRWVMLLNVSDDSRPHMLGGNKGLNPTRLGFKLARSEKKFQCRSWNWHWEDGLLEVWSLGRSLNVWDRCSWVLSLLQYAWNLLEVYPWFQGVFKLYSASSKLCQSEGRQALI